MTVVCTLFEGDYHHGVAALINSLVDSGYAGRVEIGYRGTLPWWAGALHGVAGRDNSSQVAKVPGCAVEVCWRRFDAVGHFTNLKPQFMKLVWDAYPAADLLCYFDPDIVLIAKWSFFEQWVGRGIGHAEDARPPMPGGHPRRRQWREIFGTHGFTLKFRTAAYANGGFVGVHREAKAFLDLWQAMMVVVERYIGGLDVSGLPGGRQDTAALDVNAPFSIPDQDALNAAVEAFEGEVTTLGREAMGFIPGGYVMSHAVGTPKPWQKQFVKQALSGLPPSSADKAFWQQPLRPINPFESTTVVRWKRLSLALGILIGRFYSRRY